MSKKIKTVEGRVQLLKVMPYKGYQTYLLRIDKDLFVWLVSKEPIFLGHLVVTPGKDGKPLTDSQTVQAAATAFAGATTTVDYQLDPKGLEKKANKEYKVCLKATGQITTRTTNKGTIAKLVDSSLININIEKEGRPERRTKGQTKRQDSDRPATANNNDKKDKALSN